jgi:hypothetical protein
VSYCTTTFILAAAALTASVLRVGHRSRCVTIDRARARRLSRAPITLCSIHQYSHRVSSPCAARRRPCRLVAEAMRRVAMACCCRRCASAGLRALMRVGRCVKPLSCRRRRSTTVLHRRAVGATTLSRAPAAGPLCHRVVGRCAGTARQDHGSRVLCKPVVPVLCHWATADSAQWPSICFFYFLNIFKSLQIQNFVYDSFELRKF